MAITDGTEIELQIVDLAYGGKGVGRLDGMAVFVPGTLEGELVRVRVTRVHKRYAEAQLMAVIAPSPHRMSPVCPLSDRCPGCVYQHVDYAAEVRIKGQQFKALMQRIAGMQSLELLDAQPSPVCLGYRNKVVLHVGAQGELGYVGHDNLTILDVEQCPLAVPAINAVIAETRADAAFMKSLQAGDSVTFRWTAQDGVRRYLRSDSKTSPLVEVLPCGPLSVAETGFFQVNSAVAALLVHEVQAIIERQHPVFVIDLYGGVGVFALTAARCGVPHILGVEVDGIALRQAKSNARRLGFGHVTFIEGDAARVFVDAIRRVNVQDALVIVDPPRDGLSDALRDALAEHRPASLLYISCAPDTLARDVKCLGASGYQVQHSRVLDMFPRTAHFETLTLLSCGK